MKRAQLILHTALALVTGAGLVACGGSNSKDTDTGEADGDSKGSTSAADESESSSENSPSTGQKTDNKDKSETAQEGTSDGGKTQVGSLTPETYCDAFAKVVCQGDQSCCTDDAKKFADAASCETELRTRCSKDILKLVKDARTGFDGKVAKTELDRLAGLVKDCDLKTAAWFVVSPGLRSMYRGTVAIDGSCTPSDTEDAGAMLSCKGGGTCILTPIPLGGTCKAEARADGDTCFSHVECGDGLFCTADKGGVGTCKARQADGSDCSDGLGCSSYYCESSKCVSATKNLVYCAK